MKIYIAARYGRRTEMQERAHALMGLGIEITSGWITGRDEIPGISSDNLEDYPPEHVARFAQVDLDELTRADTLLTFSESSKGRGGRHVELGYALALRKRILMVGGREHAFAYLPQITHFPDWEAVFHQLWLWCG